MHKHIGMCRSQTHNTVKDYPINGNANLKSNSDFIAHNTLLSKISDKELN